jgi:hypothetical protein
VITTPGSLKALVDQIVALEAQVQTRVNSGNNGGTYLTANQLLRTYRWQPHVVQPPALWNWIGNAPYEQRDQTRFRDNVQVLVRIGILHGDTDQEMVDLETIADHARDMIDPALNKRQNPGPLGGAATWAIRQGMRTAVWDIGGVQLLGIELPLMCQLDRQVPPT